MNKNWEIVTIGDICDVGRGASPRPIKDPKNFGGSIPWIKIADASSEQKYVKKTLHTVTEYGASKSKFLKKGSLIVANSGTVGFARILALDGCIHDGWLYLTNFRRTMSDYLFYTINYYRRHFEQLASGVTQKNLNVSLMKNFKISLPDLATQNKISLILTTYDNLIENNTRRIQILEEMAQRIYKQWFVDFKYLGHENDKLVDSELGMIPEGWEVQFLDDLALTTDYVANGSFAALKENVNLYDEPEYALYIRKKDYSSNFTNLKYVDKSSYKFLKKSELHGDEFIITNVGDVGTVFRAPVWLGKPMTLGSNSILIRSEDYNNYLFYFFKSHIGQYKINSIVSGSAQPKFNKTEFRKLKVLIPLKNLIDSFDSIINVISKQLNSLKKKQINLKNTRDYLLPKLISGKIDISDLDIDTSILHD